MHFLGLWGGKARVCVRAPKNGRREAGRAHLLKAEDVFLPVPDFITKKTSRVFLNNQNMHTTRHEIGQNNKQ